ncbi:MAG: hypothetical protein M5U01_34470 [Ardenticatenaceae bacterium]|nr:hypothetical protein [Ardenticatenaceae bacterium]
MTEHVGSGNAEERIEQSIEQRRWVWWGGVALMIVLLLGAAFAGGRLLAQQNVTPATQGVQLSRPAELPEEPPVAMGPVTKVEGKTVILEMPAGGGGVVYSGPGGTTKKEGEWKQIQVVATQDTKIYRDIPIKPEELQKGRQQLQVEEVTLADVKVGEQIEVWGQKIGDRALAEVIYIPRLLGLP